MRIAFVQLLAVLLSVTLVAEALPVPLPTFASFDERALKVKTPKLGASKVKVPKVSVPKVKAPKVKVPKVKAPKAKVPKVKAPKVKTPKAKVSTTLKAATIAPKATGAVTGPKKAATQVKAATTPKVKVAAPATTPKKDATQAKGATTPKVKTAAPVTTPKITTKATPTAKTAQATTAAPSRTAEASTPAVDSCPIQTTCNTCVAAKDAEGKTCVFKFAAGVVTGTCSSAKTANGPSSIFMKTKAQCTAGEKAQVVAAEKKAKTDALKLRADAKILFEKSNPAPGQGQSAKDHVLQGPFEIKTSGRHLLTNWDATRLPEVRKTATFDDNTGIVDLDVKSAGTTEQKKGAKILKTVFNNEASNTAHPAVWTNNQVIDACITAIAATLKSQGKLVSQGQRPRGIVVTNPKGVNVCITVALETCFPSKIGAVTGAPGSVC